MDPAKNWAGLCYLLLSDSVERSLRKVVYGDLC
jgi:hypothetical protein